MLDKPPPSRYRIVERDRRLVTIDTWSGQETGTTASSEAASLEGRSIRLGAGPQEIGQGRAMLGTTAVQASAAAPSNAPSNTSANAPAKPGPWGVAPPSLASTKRQTKIIGLVFAGLAIATVLILTNLWLPALVVLLVPQIRNPVWAAVKPALLRFLGGS
jgi:hypothetical protein